MTSAAPRAPQQRRLLRVPDLSAFRRVLAAAALDGDPAAVRRRALILPSRSAIELLRRHLEDALLVDDGAACVLPLLLTREDWVSELHAGLIAVPRLLSRVEREVLIERAALAAKAVAPPPFGVRPGLIPAMLDFYDELRRRGRTVARFEEVLAQELSGADDADDRGTQELARQTAFLARVFHEYEASVPGSGGIDEHGVRERVLAAGASFVWPVEHVVVAVADHPTDPRGLWPADFDLLGRLPTVREIDILVTLDAHDAGFRERIDREVPDLQDIRLADEARPSPTIVVPAADPADRATTRARVYSEYRDREDEVRAVAREIRARVLDAGGEPAQTAPLSRTAIVFQRPLPYLYLAQQVLTEAGVPFQAFDTLPLSAEPYAALLDLALAVARTGGTRESALALLRSPLLSIVEDGEPVSLLDVAALDRVLLEARVQDAPADYIAAADRVLAQGDPAHPVPSAVQSRVRRAARAAARMASDLAVFRTAPTASAQVGALAAVLRREERPAPPEARERHLRARSAVLSSLDALADALRLHDDRPRSPDDLSAAVHHWIERQSFAPRQGDTGVHLVDAVAARFGDFDHVHIVGLVDAEWPERQRRSIFYTTELLKDLGWPRENDHLRAAQAAFNDLLRLPARTLSLTAFLLEGEAVVAVTPLVENAEAFPREDRRVDARRVFADERLPLAPVSDAGLSDDARAWLALRQARPPLAGDAYRGQVGAVAPQEYRVSALDRYTDCPFKYFAAHVLKLDEEPDEDAALTPRERGTLLHRLFEMFYREWAEQGWGAITKDRLAEAIERFEAIAHAALGDLPEADRVIETQRLLGSIVARGVAERVFQAEADDPRDVVNRSLEFSLNGTYEFPTGGFAPAKAIAIRGVADRIDEFADGSLRLIDYKLTRAPEPHAVQLKVYGYAAQQRFAKNGTPRVVTAAEYISFGDDDHPVTSVREKNSTVEQAVIVGAQQFAQYVARIESGDFRPEPVTTGLCQWCAFAMLCRRESVTGKEGDDAAAESV